MQQNQSQNPMAVEPVPKLMARIGLPIVLSMILQAAYNVVDSAYLARMASGGETALTALSLAFPVQLFMVAVSIGTGVGTNALLARLLGLGDKDRADTAVGNAQFLALVISAVFMLFSAVGGGALRQLPKRGRQHQRRGAERGYRLPAHLLRHPLRHRVLLGVRENLAGYRAVSLVHRGADQWTACASSRWVSCLRGCASHSRGCSRHWSAA